MVKESKSKSSKAKNVGKEKNLFIRALTSKDRKMLQQLKDEYHVAWNTKAILRAGHDHFVLKGEISKLRIEKANAEQIISDLEEQILGLKNAINVTFEQEKKLALAQAKLKDAGKLTEKEKKMAPRATGGSGLASLMSND